MRAAARRLSLEGAIRALLVSTIVLVALGSNWSPSMRSVAQPLWRVSLAALCLASVVFAVRRLGLAALARRVASPLYVAVAVFLVAAAASAAWSVDPKLTVGRAGSFAFVLVTGAALALASAGDRAAIERLLVAIVAGVTLTALLGVAVLVVAHDHALQAATTTIPTRYRGIGENPNTTALLYAPALPLTVWLALARIGRARLLAAGAAVLLAASIVGSGSRGAIATGTLAILVVLLAGARTHRERLRSVVAVAIGAALAVALVEVPDANPAAREPAGSACVSCKQNPYNVDQYFRLEDELGRPTAGDAGQKRGLLGSTGRFDAWRGAIDQGADRPLLGYGFGTEDRVFLDRFYSFFGGSAENSYIGLFLQLGLAGLLALAALVATLARALVTLIARLGPDDRRAVAACTAVFAAGLEIAFVQSYLYAAGSDATLTVWTSAFLGLALAPRAAGGARP